jgi:hypothetical protein
MPTISPLASLYHVLQTVQTSAQTHAELLRKSEAATRAALIDPVLRALGWDTANVQMVEPEKTINTAWRADYALHDSGGKIGLLIEAKCLGANLEKFSVVQQLLSYAFGFGVLKVIVTDGINWHFYSEFTPGHSIADSYFNLLQDDVTACALQLIRWLDAAQSGHGIQPAIPAMPVQQLIPKPEPTKKTKPISKPLQQPKKPKSEETDFTDVSQLHLLNLPAGQKPKLLRLPNGTVKPITVWKNILLEVCYLVLATNSHLNLPLPDRAGKKRFLFSRTKPETGSSTQASYQGKPIFIGTHYSAADCISNALYAIQQLSSSQKSTTLAVSF